MSTMPAAALSAASCRLRQIGPTPASGVVDPILRDRPWVALDASDRMVYDVAGIVTLCVFEILQGHRRIGAALRPERILQRWGMYVSLTIGILLIGVFDGGQFIYFQF